ncbi:hypothetical protein L6164_017827 [Bauhinia variegata]|uniref:Uncharacterized protein n=1 Tax=Bauhinia variegata TaxID=167791 RepID=A0ACB9N9C1_BAUVA|nr:hypothetical protein L6164_017827 [Bauhinia variegata]
MMHQVLSTPLLQTVILQILCIRRRTSRERENKQIQNDMVKAWVVEMKDALFDAEDLLDEIDAELYKRKLLQGMEFLPYYCWII